MNLRCRRTAPRDLKTITATKAKKKAAANAKIPTTPSARAFLKHQCVPSFHQPDLNACLPSATSIATESLYAGLWAVRSSSPAGAGQVLHPTNGRR